MTAKKKWKLEYGCARADFKEVNENIERGNDPFYDKAWNLIEFNWLSEESEPTKENLNTIKFINEKNTVADVMELHQWYKEMFGVPFFHLGSFLLGNELKAYLP